MFGWCNLLSVHLSFSSSHDLGIIGLSPMSGFMLSGETASDSLPLSSVPPTHALSLKQINLNQSLKMFPVLCRNFQLLFISLNRINKVILKSVFDKLQSLEPIQIFIHCLFYSIDLSLKKIVWILLWPAWCCLSTEKSYVYSCQELGAVAIWIMLFLLKGIRPSTALLWHLSCLSFLFWISKHTQDTRCPKC